MIGDTVKGRPCNRCAEKNIECLDSEPRKRGRPKSDAKDTTKTSRIAEETNPFRTNNNVITFRHLSMKHRTVFRNELKNEGDDRNIVTRPRPTLVSSFYNVVDG